MSTAHCKLHPDVSLVCPACLGAAGGAATAGITSKAKARASKRNGRLGGRPPLPKHHRLCRRKGNWLDQSCPRCAHERAKIEKQTESKN